MTTNATKIAMLRAGLPTVGGARGERGSLLRSFQLFADGRGAGIELTIGELHVHRGDDEGRHELAEARG